MSRPFWSIIMASRNGEHTLPRMLDSLAAEMSSENDVEVLLVDNASDDATFELLQAAAMRFGWLAMSEPRAGKAFALNNAIEAARGEWLIFLDDDVVVQSGFLSAYRSTVQTHPDCALIAGAIIPEWLGEPPEWLKAMAARGKACGCTDPAAVAGTYPAEQVKGGNFAIRRSALGHIRFDEGVANFGAGRRPLGGLDTRIAAALRNVESGILHVPDAKVAHLLGKEDVAARAVFMRQMRIGRNYAAVRQADSVAVAKAIAKIGVFAPASLVLSLIGPPRWTGRAILGLATNLGRLDEWFRR